MQTCLLLGGLINGNSETSMGPKPTSNLPMASSYDGDEGTTTVLLVRIPSSFVKLPTHPTTFQAWNNRRQGNEGVENVAFAPNTTRPAS